MVVETAIQWLMDLAGSPAIASLMGIAVAFLGFGMLFGRFSAMRVGQIALGCFILASSTELARSLFDIVPRDRVEIVFDTPDNARTLLEPIPPSPDGSGNPFDPYAGRQSAN